jgi:hypothetical protein
MIRHKRNHELGLITNAMLVQGAVGRWRDPIALVRIGALAAKRQMVWSGRCTPAGAPFNRFGGPRWMGRLKPPARISTRPARWVPFGNG